MVDVHWRGLRVLVIEDDDDLSETIADALRHAGHEVRTASDGVRGWSALHDGSPLPDVVLLDLMMPNMDGRNFRKRQLDDALLAGIPTVVMTGGQVRPSEHHALAPVALLRKPLDLGTMLAAIEEAVEPPGHARKRCGCGREYDAHSWRSLLKIGQIDNGRGVGEHLELRQCACNSTLAWEIGRHAVSLRV